jgi:hypothetical protein
MIIYKYQQTKFPSPRTEISQLMAAAKASAKLRSKHIKITLARVTQDDKEQSDEARPA